MQKADRMRLFVALLLEPEWLEALEAVQKRLRALDRTSSVRWTDPRSIHLTLKFLGEVHEERVAELVSALAGAVEGRNAPILGLGGLGAFPNRRHPRVLWVGLKEEGALLLPLQAAVESATATLGWEREGRPFQPHLTVGRVRDFGGRSSRVPQELLEAITDSPITKRGGTPHPRVALMQSHLSPQGTRYTELRVWKLL
jgi:RNA 2',3'-cyclic 3'-phosphodiesterase